MALVRICEASCISRRARSTCMTTDDASVAVPAASAAQSVVDGSATDISSVAMTVERARLEMQLASQIRNKAIQGFEEVFHTQV